VVEQAGVDLAQRYLQVDIGKTCVLGLLVSSAAQHEANALAAHQLDVLADVVENLQDLQRLLQLDCLL
jgi:hypothetical protein